MTLAGRLTDTRPTRLAITESLPHKPQRSDVHCFFLPKLVVVCDIDIFSMPRRRVTEPFVFVPGWSQTRFILEAKPALPAARTAVGVAPPR